MKYTAVLISFAVLASLVFAFCNDTDNGYNIYSKGTCYDVSSHSDYCINSRTLNDFSCAFNASINASSCTPKQITCPSNYVCSNGACVRSEHFCNDTDNGYNIYSKGTCYEITPNATIPYADYCVNRSLIEFTCVGGYPNTSYCAAHQVSCPYGYVCSSGACRRKFIPTIASRSEAIPTIVDHMNAKARPTIRDNMNAKARPTIVDHMNAKARPTIVGSVKYFTRSESETIGWIVGAIVVILIAAAFVIGFKAHKPGTHKPKTAHKKSAKRHKRR